MKNIKLLGKNVLIYGAGSSGQAVQKLLQKNKIKTTIYDDDKKVLKTIQYCKTIFNLDKLTFSRFSSMIVSPSIRQDNEWVQFADSCGLKVFSEVEVASIFCRGKKIFITGTNGKTTVTQMLAHVLKEDKYKGVGNIGYPFSLAVFENPQNNFVVEVSSFMLEYFKNAGADIGTITNITYDHLDRHETFEDYKTLKLSILNHCRKVVINLDDNSAYGALKLSKKKRVLFYSMNFECIGAFVEDEIIYIKKHKNATPVKLIKVEELGLNGKHNIENFLCVLCICMFKKIPLEKVIKSIKAFKLDRHRYEVYDINGIEYVNDSKSTNQDSCQKACESSQKDTILLLGGSNKKLDYINMFNHLPINIKTIICFGQIKETLKEHFDKSNKKTTVTIYIEDNAKNAIQKSKSLAQSGMRVLFSPATASFDEFKNYKERGEYFVKSVIGETDEQTG